MLTFIFFFGVDYIARMRFYGVTLYGRSLDQYFGFFYEKLFIFFKKEINMWFYYYFINIFYNITKFCVNL